ncbi:MAG: TRAP transporter substrate-binding protein DctP, partial [Candidatus Neomarinimicrobiota bacterium]|nr:TRAP transporter substrate-binding protein DctP [Candidatus Neomarinimicrobiota bacterium]
PEGTVYHGMLIEMGQQWKKATNGEVILRVYPGGIIGDERDMIRKIRLGQFHAAAVSTEGLHEINPDVYVFSLPLVYDNYDDVEWMRSQIDDRIRTGMSKNGFELLTWADVGWVHHFSTEPVVYPEDLKKLKMFVWAGGYKAAELWKKGGFQPVPLASTDIMPGLQTGLIQSASTVSIFALSQQLFGIANYMLDMKWGLLTGALIIDSRTWHRIKPEYQKAMISISKAIIESKTNVIRDGGEAAISSMEEYGLKVHRQTPDELKVWKEFVGSWADEIRGGYISVELYDTVQEIMNRKPK